MNNYIQPMRENNLLLSITLNINKLLNSLKTSKQFVNKCLKRVKLWVIN